MDQHAKRTARDMIEFAFNFRVHRTAPAIANVLFGFVETSDISLSATMSETLETIIKYREAIEFVVSIPISTTYFAAPFLAAFVLEVHKFLAIGKDLEPIAKFMARVEKGEMLKNDQPEFHLRNYIASSSSNTGGRSLRNERFLKAGKALRAYLDGTPMKILRS